MSSTAKCVIIMKYFPEWIYAVCSFGRNAWPFICELLQGGYTLTMIVNYFVLAEDVINNGFDVYLDNNLVVDGDVLEDTIADYFDQQSEYRKELEYSYSEDSSGYAEERVKRILLSCSDIYLGKLKDAYFYR